MIIKYSLSKAQIFRLVLKKDSTIYCQQETHFKYKDKTCKIKRMKKIKIYFANTTHKLVIFRFQSKTIGIKMLVPKDKMVS